MIKKLLIANRGEIALRIIRTCKEMDIKTVAVYSDADKDSLHVKFADEAVCIGSSLSKDSYLNIPRIMSAATITNADAIHPGYGFLAENAEFAEICIDSKINFIGPLPSMINSMGNKSLAKDTMRAAGVPVVPGSDGVVKDLEEATALIKQIGVPVMIKASAGGGGKGMRIVRDESEIESAFNTAKSEALSSFGNDDVYLEKYVDGPRHIEIQVLGDKFGNVISLGERDCSIQRRHQKLIEESPSPFIDNTVRQKMSEAAIKGAKSVNYIGAGTIEFLVDKDKNFYFMEMNTRIQVEHPVTEAITGIDLIREQIRIADRKKLSKKKIAMNGHSIECRINAEDPANNFRPSPGIITAFNQPGGIGVRVDTHCYNGYTIPPYYDSMIGKLIVHASTRTEAIKKMSRALDEFIVEGIHTTIPFHKMMMMNDNFINNDFDTGFIDNLNKS
ncbi:MAG TPA: acetyl-CoA carboxylase biotin carboxylase subunit [Ignavibacteria bacterium]|nr:acetyl-CoA carboxylase biotin carboxylase subunit [Bacteroidota bacterium]HRI85052.1 acetyl-CoA carboxylase biotin carboxylase subunit [Ignavibacteria bacterium]HRJ99741.1 acetyl-CoA carboxylase biotin carboxylase subunit [Ignavibacteria bacterium]